MNETERPETIPEAHQLVEHQAVTVQKSTSPVKKYFLYILIGGLVVSALISIVSILIGEFSDTSGKALLTTISIVIHSLIGLAFLSADHNEKKSTALITNTVFAIVIASLVTTIFGIWELVDGDIVGNLYQTYFVALIAVLFVSALLNTSMQDKVVNVLSWATIGNVMLLFIALVPWIFEDNNYILPEAFFRILAALAILLATLAVITTIFERLYQMKHPKQKQPQDSGASLAVKIIAIVVAVIFGIPMAFGMLFGLLGAFMR